MRYKLIDGSGSADSLILFFNGWAMTSESVEHLYPPQQMDIVTLWDYSSLSKPEGLTLDHYTHIYIVAWSMGVWAADTAVSRWLAPYLSRVERAIAVCGTGYPVHDQYGITLSMYADLLALLRTNRKRFDRRMCGAKAYRHLLEALSVRTTEDIECEIHNAVAHLGDSQVPKTVAMPWTHALIAGLDRVIPPDHQTSYWSAIGTPYTIYPDAEHYFFGTCTHWDTILGNP